MIKRWLSHPIVDLALKALGRNRLQTGLTMLGMMVGVATVLAMMAVGAGAQQSIEQQVRAAGLNQLTVRAGNWRPKVEDTGEAIAHGDARDTLTLPKLPGLTNRFRFPDSGSGADPVPSSDTGDRHRIPAPVCRLPVAVCRAVMPFPPPSIPKTIRWRSTITRWRGSAWAISRPGSAPRPRSRSRMPKPSRRCAASSTWPAACTRTRACTLVTSAGSPACTAPTSRCRRSSAAGCSRTAASSRAASRTTPSQVIVIGQVVADKLFGAGEKAVGQEVMMWNQPFEVVGVVTSSTWVVQPAPGDDQFDAVYMPYTTTHRLLNLSKLNDITITAASSGRRDTLARDITALLRQRHGIGDNQADDFTVLTQATKALTTGGLPPSVARAVAGNVAELEKVTLEQLATTLERASRTMTWLLAAVAAVSLVVGGIGIMNITLLSVTERTREIGLRLAVGARSRDVMKQFLIEAVTISLAGGVAGIILGIIAAALIARTLNWATVVSPMSVLLAFGVAGAVGIFFGWYPAKRASLLDPIVALRRE